jgi:hypothetical protein
MKQLLPLFLFLLPCLAWAQYPSNGNQKITLGEQTTADGLIWRGRLADTANLLTNKLDTSVYIVLDTGTRAMWYYRASTTPKWTRLVDSLNNFQGQLSLTTKVTGVLPVTNGGTGTGTAFTHGSVVFAGADGTYNQKNNALFFNSATNRFGVGKIPTDATLDVAGSGKFISTLVGTDANFSGSFNANSYGIAGILNSLTWTTNTLRIGQGDYWKSVELWDSASIVLKTIQGGNVGIGQISPTALLHLKAGTATAAPIRLTSSGATLLSAVESGAVEFNGTNLLFTPSTTRHTVNHGLTNSATLNFPSTTTLLSADLTITVTGAADGDVVSLGVPNAAVNANTSYSAWVSAANTVTVRFNNYSNGTVDPASALFKVFVTK